MKENTSAGPAPKRMTTPSGPTCPAAAVPIAPKMPAPMTAPIASITRSPAPSSRFSALGWSPSATSSAMGLRAKRDLIDEPRARVRSEEQRRQYQRDGAEQLHEHVERRAGRILEWITHGVADDRRLVGLGTLAAVRSRLDVFLRVVPGTAAVVEETGHEDAGDRPHHQERRDRLRTHVLAFAAEVLE